MHNPRKSTNELEQDEIKEEKIDSSRHAVSKDAIENLIDLRLEMEEELDENQQPKDQSQEQYNFKKRRLKKKNRSKPAPERKQSAFTRSSNFNIVSYNIYNLEKLLNKSLGLNRTD